MKQFNPFQFLAAVQVVVDSVIVFCEGPHVTLMSGLCVLSNVRSLRYVLANPSVSLHSLSLLLNLAQCPPLNILPRMGNTLIRSVRPIRSGFEENLKCPISSFNVLSLCSVPSQWGRGNPFSLIVASFGGVRFTSHSLDPQQMFCDVMNRN